MLQQIPEFIGNHLLLVVAFLTVLAILIGSELLRRRGAPGAVTPESLVALMNNGTPVIVDTRPSSDFRKGHIMGARNITADQLGTAKLSGESVVLYCANGMNAPRAAATLQASGVANVATLKGGVAAWRDAKLPLSMEKSTKKEGGKKSKKNKNVEQKNV